MREFPSFLQPLFQNESSCKSFLKISLMGMKMNLGVKHIFIIMVTLEDSFSH